MPVESSPFMTTKEERRWAHEQSLASACIEGYVPDPDFLADCEALIEQTMTPDQAVTASLARARSQATDRAAVADAASAPHRA